MHHRRFVDEIVCDILCITDGFSYKPFVMTFIYKVSKQWLLVPLKPASYILYIYIYIVRSPSTTFDGSSTQHEENETAATSNFIEPPASSKNMAARRARGHTITWMSSIGNWTSLCSESDMDAQVHWLESGFMYQQPTIPWCQVTVEQYQPVMI